MTLFYLATPYSKYPDGTTAAFRDAAALAGRLLKAGYYVFSPIAHSHPIAIYSDLDLKDYNIWLALDFKIIAGCDAMLIAKMDGWDKSFGIGEEIKVFEAAGKPIYEVDPETLRVIAREKK